LNPFQHAKQVEKLRILGIDPGTNVTGYGVIEKNRGGLREIHHGEIRVPRDLLLSGRLMRIHGALLEVVEKTDPDQVALEDIFYGKNVKSLIKQGHARGVILLAASRSGLPVYEYSPLEIKQAVVGYGRAEKSQVQQMVMAILGMKAAPRADAADALAVAICHAHFKKTEAI
jgi:crossover junction endodeoxyribonuclease RuvC